MGGLFKKVNLNLRTYLKKNFKMLLNKLNMILSNIIALKYVSSKNVLNLKKYLLN